MFGLFGPRGWDALPNSLVQEIRVRLGDDFRDLNELADRHGMFRQQFFRRPARDFLDVEFEVDAFAFLVGSLGNQLAQREKFAEAQRSFELSLKLKPKGNPIAYSLAHLHALQDNLVDAVPPAKLALDVLWDDAEMRTTTDGQKMHVMLARILTEAKLREVLGKSLLELAREALALRDSSWTDEQRDRSVYASLEFGGPNHDAAVSEALDVTEDSWFDVAIELVAQQFDANREIGASGFDAYRQGLESDLVYSRVVPLAIACTRLNPEHIDAWVLVARLRDMGAHAGMGYEEQAFKYAHEALWRIDEYLNGSEDLLATKDPSLLGQGDPDALRDSLIEFLKTWKGAATPDDLERASEYLS